ncbi:MAG: helix-turn-helix transcriptional regulator [Spirochaetales bacterium]|nr:helix-turn-helix transcriptional regulator [Spirochaetales bacterium]
MELLQFFQVTPSELFKAYEEDDHVQLGNIPNEISSEDILSAFSIHMEENSISKSELARRMGVDKSYLSSLFSLRYTSNLTMYTIRRIANALEIKLSHIFSIAERFKDSI